MKQIPAAESQHSGGEEVFVFPLSLATWSLATKLIRNVQPDYEQKTLLVKLRRVGSPLQDAAVAKLCDELTATETRDRQICRQQCSLLREPDYKSIQCLT